jgi:hypothetical protein
MPGRMGEGMGCLRRSPLGAVIGDSGFGMLTLHLRIHSASVMMQQVNGAPPGDVPTPFLV